MLERQVRKLRNGSQAEIVAAFDAVSVARTCVSTAFTLLVILMTMSEFASVADAKAHLSELVSRVGSQHDRVTVTVHGRPTAVLVAVDDLEALEETISILSDAATLSALRDSEAELARGEGEDQDTLTAAIRARRATA